MIAAEAEIMVAETGGVMSNPALTRGAQPAISGFVCGIPKFCGILEMTSVQAFKTRKIKAKDERVDAKTRTAVKRLHYFVRRHGCGDPPPGSRLRKLLGASHPSVCPAPPATYGSRRVIVGSRFRRHPLSFMHQSIGCRHSGRNP